MMKNETTTMIPSSPPPLSSSSVPSKLATMIQTTTSSEHYSRNHLNNTRLQVGDMDVICGRGKAGFNHPGNIRFRTAVTQAMNDYQQAEDRTEKPFIVNAIISNTYSTGGCFLRRCDNHHILSSQSDDNQPDTAWMELNFQEQKDKVRHALRDAIAEVKTKEMRSLQCRHQQLRPNNVGSTTKAATSGPITSTTASNVGMDPVVSMSSVLHQKQVPTEIGVGGNVVQLPLPSTAISTLLNAFPNSASAVVQHLLQYNSATTPSPPTLLKGLSGGGYALGNNTMVNRIGNEDDSRRLVAMQLAAHQQQQLQLAQMNSHNRVNLSIALQIYEQQHVLQKEQQLIQNVQNCIAMNANKMAVQRDCMQLQAYIANLRNAPSQQGLW